MNLGKILERLEEEGAVARLLPDLGDAEWQARAQKTAATQGEALGDYAGAAVARFASSAPDEEWLSLLSALNRAADPGAVCLRRIIDWAMNRDKAS